MLLFHAFLKLARIVNSEWLRRPELYYSQHESTQGCCRNGVAAECDLKFVMVSLFCIAKMQVPAVNLKMTNKTGQNVADSFSEGMFQLSRHD